MPNREPAKAEVLRGTLDLMVLQTLAALGPQHGYAIGARLEQVSSGALTLNMGTLYPGLMRLEQQGLVKAEQRMGRRRIPELPIAFKPLELIQQIEAQAAGATFTSQ